MDDFVFELYYNILYRTVTCVQIKFTEHRPTAASCDVISVPVP